MSEASTRSRAVAWPSSVGTACWLVSSGILPTSVRKAEAALSCCSGRRAVSMAVTYAVRVAVAFSLRAVAFATAARQAASFLVAPATRVSTALTALRVSTP